MRKILYISYDGMTDQLGQSQVIPYLRELSGFGYQFTILSMEKKERLQKIGPVVRAQLKDAGIGWETLSFTTRPPFLSKWYDQKRLNRKALLLHRENNFDAVHCRSYVPAEAGFGLHKRTGLPVIFDMRGFWVDERVDAGLWNLRNPVYKFLYRLYKRKERRYFREAAHVISLTEKGRQELVAHYKVPAEKLTVIPCCADLQHFDFHTVNEEQRKAARASLGIEPGTRVLSYLGSLGGWYMTDEMMEFFAIMKKKIPDSIFQFITHDKPEGIVQKAEQKGISAADIRVQPAQRREVPLYLSLSDWNIFFIKDVYSKIASSPTKQGEVLAMGIPVLCNDIGDTGRIVEESGTGIVIRSFDTKEYERVASLLQGLKAKDRESIRAAARQYYDLHKGVASYRQVYDKVFGAN